MADAALRALKLSDLRKRAAVAGATADEIELALDDEQDLKEALIALIVAYEQQPKVNHAMVVSLGACTIDTIMRVTDLPEGDCKVLAQDAIQIASGMATSAACAAARLGAKAVLLGRVGQDALGDFFLANLKDTSVDTSHVQQVLFAKTPLSAVIVDGKGRRMVVPYFDVHLGDDTSWLPLPSLLQSSDGGTRQHCCALADVRWPAGAEMLLRTARQMGIPAVFDGDVATVDVLRRLAPLASHAVFSEKGFQIFSGQQVYTDASLESAAASLGIVVAVTLGSKGLVFAVGGASSAPQAQHIAAPCVEAIDTLAAGDVFHGAYALALAEHRSLVDAAHFAIAAAAIKCTRFGGRLGTPTRLEVEEFLRTATASQCSIG